MAIILKNGTRRIHENPVVPYNCKYCNELLIGTNVEVLYSWHEGLESKGMVYWVFCNKEHLDSWYKEYAKAEPYFLNSAIKYHISAELEMIK